MYTSAEQAHRDILEVGRRLYQRGFVAANDGNISVRMADGTVWTTPSGVSKGFLTADQLIRVTPDGQVVEGQGAPSSELQLHLAVYAACADVGAVVHAHPPVSTAYSALGLPFDAAVSTEAVLSLGVVPCAPYAVPGSRELADTAAQYARDYNAVLLQAHGSVSWGSTALDALYRLESAEHTILTWQHMQAMGIHQLLTQAQVRDLIALRPNFGLTRGGVPKGMG